MCRKVTLGLWVKVVQFFLQRASTAQTVGGQAKGKAFVWLGLEEGVALTQRSFA